MRIFRIVVCVAAAMLVVCAPMSAHASGLGPGYFFVSDNVRARGVPMFYAYDPANLRVGLVTFVTGQQASAPSLTIFQRWISPRGGMDITHMQVAAQDMQLRGPMPMSAAVALYGYGGNKSALIAWRTSAWTSKNPYNLAPGQVWRSSAFDERRSKLTMTKIATPTASFLTTETYAPAVLYDYGSQGSALWYFRPSEPLTFTATRGPLLDVDWHRCRVIGGDVDGDGTGDVVLVYDYGNARTGIWVVDGVTRKPYLAWKSLAGGFDPAKAKFVTGDFDGDSCDEVAAVYDRGGVSASVFVWNSGKESGGSPLVPLEWWRGRLSCSWSGIDVTASDLTVDGACDLALFADDIPLRPAIWALQSSRASFYGKPIECTRMQNWIYERTVLAK